MDRERVEAAAKALHELRKYDTGYGFEWDDSDPNYIIYRHNMRSNAKKILAAADEAENRWGHDQ